MPGTKRTHSFAFPAEKESLSKRKSSIRVYSGPLADAGSPTPPALRRASTMEVDEGARAPEMKSLKSKSSLSKPASLSRKSSSFVDEGVLETRLSGLRSGSVIGETSASGSKSASLTKSKSSMRKSESIAVAAVDETELSTAVSELKSHLSKEGSSPSKKASLVSVPSLSALTKLSSVKSRAEDDGADDAEPSTSDAPADVAMLPPGGLLELAISFDTTGSMYSCLEEVRAKVQDLVQRLQADIPGIRIAIIAHGDYCDEHNYIVKWLDFGASVPEICDFVKTVSRTGGGDGPECYELVLQRAREVLSWTPGSQRILVMIGDDEPHPVGYRYGDKTYNIDWKEECAALRDMNVKIYAVQARPDTRTNYFYNGMANTTGGCRLTLNKFSSLFDFLMMICYREANPDMIAIYQQEILDREGRIADDINAMTKTFGVKSKPILGAFGIIGPVSKKIAVVKKAATAKKATTAKKTTTAKKATTAKKGVKALTKGAKATKAAGGKTKKSKKKTKPINRQLREKLNDACMSKGPLKKLKWTNWEPAVLPELPNNKQKSKFTKLRNREGYRPKTLFGEKVTQGAIYEIAVQLPGKSRKKYAMYMISKLQNPRVKPWSSLLRPVKLRREWKNALSLGCTIYIRRGSLSPKAKMETRKSTEAYIRKNFDYAWNKYIWRRSKSTSSKLFNLTHRTVQMKRGGKTYKLSSGEV